MEFTAETARLSINFGPKALLRIPFRANTCIAHFVNLNFPVNLPDSKAEVWIFPSIPCTSEGHRTLWGERGLLFYSPRMFPRYLADLSVDFNTYLSSFGAKARSTLRRKVRKFVEIAGTNCLRQLKSPEEMLEFHTQARQLSLKTYQENLLHLGLPDSSEFREKMLVMAQGDQVRAFLLSMSGNVL